MARAQGARQCDAGAARLRRRRRMVASLLGVLFLGSAAAADRDLRVRPDDSPPGRVLYFEESGGLITAVPKPSGPGSKPRSAIPPKPQEPAPPPPRAAHTAPKPAGTAAPALKLESKISTGTRCEDPATSLAEADRRAGEGSAERAAQVLESLATCPQEATRLAALERARSLVDRATFEQSWIARERTFSRGPEAERRFQRMAYALVLERFATARGSAAERAAALSEAAGESIVAFRDAPVALSLGWLWLDASDPASASQWFGRAHAWAPASDEAVKGLAIAAQAERDYDRALSYAEQLPPGAEREKLRREALLAIAQRDYRAERYVDAAERYAAAAKLGDLPRDARFMQAGSVLALGDRRSATDLYTALYREAPDAESANGLMASARNDERAIEPALAATEPLATMVRKAGADRAYAGNRFLQARALDRERYGAIGASGVPQAAAAASWRDKTGGEGFSRLVAYTGTAQADMPVDGAAMVGVSYQHSRLESGTPDPGVPLGSASQAGPGGYAETRDAFRQARLNIQYERDLALLASLGATGGGPLPSRTVAALAVIAASSKGEVRLEASSAPIDESVLSLAGMRDPATGDPWGGVLRHRVELRALWYERSPWSVGGSVAAARITGTQVAHNTYTGGQVFAGYDLGIPTFSYSTLSFGVGSEHYERNLSHFTLGHGGYFSPQKYDRVGFAFDFMTRENHTWVVRGRVSAARVDKVEDPAPILPLADDGRTYGATRGIGRDISLRVAGAVSVSPYVQLGLVLSHGDSPQYRENQALLQVKVLFEPRLRVASTDLPRL